MTTYVYEIIPKHPGTEPRYFEIKQPMQDAPLAKHPETGEAVRRVILGGYGAWSKGNPTAPKLGCGSGCGCH